MTFIQIGITKSNLSYKSDICSTYFCPAPNVDFYKPFEEVNFFDSFNGFVESYCKQLDQSDQKYIEFRKEFSTISRKLFKKYENNRFQYLNEIMIQFHQVLSKHGLD